ncbi:MAG: DUF308 domain-containing protein [Muribaculaceae bacterium]|nr:DUF308 domain-containing protein [Muribaculaceae bacterium]
MDYKRILWTSLLILAVGILLLCYKTTSLDLCVRFLGALLVGSSVLNIAMQIGASRQRKEDGKKHSITSLGGMFTAVASFVLGLWMLLSPEVFTTAMVYIFGAMMILSGLFLIYTMFHSYKPVKFPFGFYILPILVTICGIVICLISPETTKAIIITVTAIAMIVYSVGAIIMVSGLISYNRQVKAEESATADDKERKSKETEKSEETPSQPSITEAVAKNSLIGESSETHDDSDFTE